MYYVNEAKASENAKKKKITDVNVGNRERATSLDCRPCLVLSGLPLVTTQTRAGLEDHQPEELRVCRFHTWSLNWPLMRPTSPFVRVMMSALSPGQEDILQRFL